MDTNLIKQIIQIFEESNVNKMDLETKGIKISLQKQTQNIHENVAPAKIETVKTEVKEDTSAYIKAPFVGTYYAAPSENSEPFVKVGQKVNKGDTLCIIEAMKVMNEIKAHKDGIVKDIKAVNGKMVEFNAPLILMGE